MSGTPLRCTMVSILAIRGAGADAQVLLLHRALPPLRRAWVYVAGHIEPGEKAWQCALRELHEETGLRASALYSADTCETYYDAHEECISVVPAFVAFVDAGAPIQLNPENDEHRWLSFADAEALLPFGGQRDLFAQVRREFVERTPPQALLVPCME